MKQEFEMLQSEMDEILRINREVKNMPVMSIGGHDISGGKAEAINAYWKKLGDKYGFKWNTVEGSAKGKLFFLAEPIPPPKKKTGLELIAAERQEQISIHGYDHHHDDEMNDEGQLRMAAEAIIDGDDSGFPANWDLTLVQKMCDKPKRERLIVSGALFRAEQERIERRIKEIAIEIDTL